MRNTARAAAALGLLALALTVVAPATAQDGTAVVVDDGHVDAVAVRIVDGALQVRYKDGSRPEAPVHREPDTVVTHVKPESRIQVPDDPAYAFLGAPGADLWLIPQRQIEGVVWAGWNTEELTASQVDPASVRWTLDAVGGDERGSSPPGVVTLFQNGAFGEPLPRVFDTHQPLPQSHGLTLGTHAHANWTFDAEGVYRLTFTVTATSARGEPLADTATYTFAIGDVDPTTVAPGKGAAPPTTTPPTTTPPTTTPPTTTPPTTTTTPPTTTTGTTGTTTPSGPAVDCVVLADGHVDAVAPRVLDGRLTTQVKDGTAGPDKAVWRDPGRVVLHVVPSARNSVPGDPAYAFLGPAGAPVWLIPQTQVPGVVWAGWNTESLDASAVRGDVTWRLTEVDGPGNVAVFLTELTPTIVFDAADGLPDSLDVPLGTHAHANWAFTEEGVYRLTFTVTATLASGGTQTDTDTYTFAVGDVDASAALGGTCTAAGTPTGTATPPAPAPDGGGDVTPRPEGRTGNLAHTGTGGLAVLVPAAVLLLAGGVALVVLFRRRAKGTACG